MKALLTTLLILAALFVRAQQGSGNQEPRPDPITFEISPTTAVIKGQGFPVYIVYFTEYLKHPGGLEVNTLHWGQFKTDKIDLNWSYQYRLGYSYEITVYTVKNFNMQTFIKTW